MAELDDTFKTIMTKFYQGDYEQGKDNLTALILNDPKNPNLYLNRALFLSQMGLDQQAIQDLQISLTLNPRSYLAYFNLFSIQTRYQQLGEAYQSICCSLSCLYLMKARHSKDITDVDHAIQNAPNNFEAHVLRGLLQLQQQHTKQALESFQQAHQINPSSQAIWRLTRITQSKLTPQGNLDLTGFKPDNRPTDKLLKGPLPQDHTDIGEETNKKLKSFNELYHLVNNELDTFTKKISQDVSVVRRSQRTMRSHGHSSIANKDDYVVIQDQGMATPQNSEAHPEVGSIFVISSNIHHSNTSLISQRLQSRQFDFKKQSKVGVEQGKEDQFVSIIQQKVEDVDKDDQFQRGNQFESVLLMEDNKQVDLSLKNTLLDSQSEHQFAKQNQFVSILAQQSDLNLEASHEAQPLDLHVDNITTATVIVELPLQQKQIGIVELPLQEKPVAVMQLPLQQTEQSAFKSQQQKLIQQQKEQIKEQLLVSSQKEPAQVEEQQRYNLLYPLDDNTKLKIRVLALNFVDKSEQEMAQLTDVYCIISYNNKHKLMTRPIACLDTICEWNQVFLPVELSSQPSDLKVKVYNKRYNSFRDDFMGDMEVLITTADLLRLPIYKKQKFVGNLLLHLQAETNSQDNKLTNTEQDNQENTQDQA